MLSVKALCDILWQLLVVVLLLLFNLFIAATAHDSSEHWLIYRADGRTNGQTVEKIIMHIKCIKWESGSKGDFNICRRHLVVNEDFNGFLSLQFFYLVLLLLMLLLALLLILLFSLILLLLL